jgi:SPP1 family predicted phage head-tail adaptor
MKLRAGKLRHRLTLQYKVETRTATGDVAWTWTTDSTVWGAIEPIIGNREYLAANQTQNEVSVMIMMRYHSTIDATWRIVNDGKAYSIQGMQNEYERDRMLILMCSQGVAEEDSLTDYFVVDFGINVLDGGIQVIDS